MTLKTYKDGTPFTGVIGRTTEESSPAAWPEPPLITYDAKDPDCAFPPIEPLRPPAGAPNVLLILLDDVGFGAASAFGGPCQTPVAERLAARPAIQSLPHHRTVLADPPGTADRSQSPFGRYGRDHRDRHRCTGLQLGTAQLLCRRSRER